MRGLNQWFPGFLKDLGTVNQQVTPPEPPLLWFCCGEEYYVMASAAGSDWVNDVRAAGGRVVMTHGGERYAAHLTELPTPEGAALLRTRLRYRRPDGKGLVRADQVRRHFGIEPDAAPDAIEAIAGHRPVFRIDTAPVAPPLGV